MPEIHNCAHRDDLNRQLAEKHNTLLAVTILLRAHVSDKTWKAFPDEFTAVIEEHDQLVRAEELTKLLKTAGITFEGDQVPLRYDASIEEAEIWLQSVLDTRVKEALEGQVK